MVRQDLGQMAHAQAPPTAGVRGAAQVHQATRVVRHQDRRPRGIDVGKLALDDPLAQWPLISIVGV